MDTQKELEIEITNRLKELRNLLSNCSTYSIAGWCFSYNLVTAHSSDSVERLSSPAKQIPFILAVMLSTPEPREPVEFGQPEWEKAKSLLDNLFWVYMALYMPSEEELGSLAPEWYKVREVSMLAFIHYFNTGLLASIQQIEERIKTYLVPFDEELERNLRISASQALVICQWITNQLQKSLDDLQDAAQEERDHRLIILEREKVEKLSIDAMKNVVQDPAYIEKAEKLLYSMKNLGFVSLSDLESEFPDIADAFWRQFSVKRGEAPEVRYPTEESIFESRPLIRISETEAFCPLVNGLLTALLMVGEKTLLQSSDRAKFLRYRDKALERETLEKISAFLSTKATILSEVYETQDSQYEHDIIAIDDSLCLIIEVKASPPIEPFRDPDKAFVRLRNAFKADTGIQKAYEQANRIVRKLKEGKVVPLYDSHGNEVDCLSPDQSKLPVAVCVTRDNFGPLATNLALLLEKDAIDAYPWVVNIIDLSNLAEAWSYFGWGPVEFRRYLEQRIQLHGKMFSDDELDYAGYFMRHGSFDSAIKTPADMLQLNPEYSNIFDEIYRHLHLGGPRVTPHKAEPVMMDLKQSLAADKPVFINAKGRARSGSRKIGRNESCPCGSGKKYKKCCGTNYDNSLHN